jgi:hypothetical protein
LAKENMPGSLLEVEFMAVIFHPHALEQMAQRGATEKQVIETVEHGEKFEAKFGRAGFRRNFVLADYLCDNPIFLILI